MLNLYVGKLWYMSIKFTENFIELCEYANQKELAEAIGVNQSQISRYFKGILPNTKTIVKICDYFKCSIDYIVGLNDNPSYKSLKSGYDKSVFYTRYEKVLKQNNKTHYQLAKNNIVCETSLRLWKKGTLPTFEALYNIANYLSVSIDYLIGRSDSI